VRKHRNRLINRHGYWRSNMRKGTRSRSVSEIEHKKIGQRRRPRIAEGQGIAIAYGVTLVAQAIDEMASRCSGLDALSRRHLVGALSQLEEAGELLDDALSALAGKAA
jgi:hypothetical protein